MNKNPVKQIGIGINSPQCHQWLILEAVWQMDRDSRWDMFKEESELTQTNNRQQSDMSDPFLVSMTTFLELGCVSLIHG